MKSRLAAIVTSRFVLAAVVTLLSSLTAGAAHIVIDEAGMNAIFTQATFGDTPINIRFNAPQQIVAPELLFIDSLAKLQALFNLAQEPAPVVTAFFVDQIDVCGVVEQKVSGVFAGCAQLPGNIFVEASPFAEISPATVMGHELAHNLNLEHDLLADFLNLMFPLFPHGPNLTEEQVATILKSPLVQLDSNGNRFIQITPVLIVGTPEPSTLLLFGAALGPLLIYKTRKSSGTGPS